MTRINGSIEPEKLLDQHLIAEYREMVRIPNAVKKDFKKAKQAIKKAPKHFKLGIGHVLYFYDKIQFLHKRYLKIKKEMDNRNIQNNMDDSMFLDIPKEFYNDIESIPKKDIIERILENASTSKKDLRIRKELISFDNYKLLLLEDSFDKD